MNPNIPAKPTRGLPLDVRHEYFTRIWGEDSVVNKLTERQSIALTLYYGLNGHRPQQTKDIQKALGAKTHTLVPGLCRQGEEALDRNKKELILKRLGVDTELHRKDMPAWARRDYISLMYGTHELDYSGLDQDDVSLFSHYYGLGLSATPTSMQDLRTQFGLKIQEIKARLKATEAQIA